MIPRGRIRSRSTEDQPYQSFLLTSRVSNNQQWDDEFDEDITPDSDAAFLRRHRSIDRGSPDPEDQVAKPGFLQRVFTFMSQSPLLVASTSIKDAASYGALRDQSSRSQSEDWDLADDDAIRNRDRREGKSSALRPAASFASFGYRPRRDDSASHSRSRFRRASLRESSPMLVAEPGHPASQGGHLGGGLATAASSEDEDEGDEVIGIDEDENVLDPMDNSPYPQVRASVAATDDISASINTPRMWSLSLLCALLGSATNLFFSLRYPSVAITPVIALVVVHPLGRAWDRLFKRPDDPMETFEYGDRVRAAKLQNQILSRSRMLRLRLWLAQGRWNGKEHACVSNL
ncbi:MAG: hypothetical protein Q9175_004845 [Cornicularia normoerica]